MQTQQRVHRNSSTFLNNENDNENGNGNGNDNDLSPLYFQNCTVKLASVDIGMGEHEDSKVVRI